MGCKASRGLQGQSLDRIPCLPHLEQKARKGPVQAARRCPGSPHLQHTPVRLYVGLLFEEFVFLVWLLSVEAAVRLGVDWSTLPTGAMVVDLGSKCTLGRLVLRDSGLVTLGSFSNSLAMANSSGSHTYAQVDWPVTSHRAGASMS